MKFKYTKLLAIAGAALPLFTMFDNTPYSPFRGADMSLRLIGGGILAIVCAGVGGAVGFAIDVLGRKK